MEDHVDPYRYYLHFPSPSSALQLDTTHPQQGPSERAHSLSDFFDSDEQDIVRAELDRLFNSFRTKIVYGQRHYAPSPTWRDELTLAGHVPAPARFVVRVHIFESRGAEAGRYLGFVSLRPPNYVSRRSRTSLAARHGFSYVIDAELTAPAHMQRPRYHLLTTTASSARLGVLPFRSAVYSAAGVTALEGSVCVHLAVSQALNLIMGRFACRPVSQVEFDCRLLEILARKGETSVNPQQRGAKLLEALQVIRECCNGGGFQMTIEPRANPQGRLNSEERRIALRFLTDALACGLPVIALVKAGHLIESDAREQMIAEGRQAYLEKPHAVLILGMHLLHTVEELGRKFFDDLHGRFSPLSDKDKKEKEEEKNKKHHRDDLYELPGRLVIHDTLSRGPYFECLTTDFMEAAEWAYGDPDSAESREDRGVHFLVIGPPNLELSHAQARTFAERVLKLLLYQNGDWVPGKRSHHPDCDSLRLYLEAGNVPPNDTPKTDDWRFICRLLNAPEIAARYEEDANLEPSATSIPLNELPSGHYWVVEVRHPAADPQRTGTTIHGPAQNPPALIYIWNSNLKGRKENQLGISPVVTLRYKQAHDHGQPS
ncbi:hypothetical protein [Verrucomicrobium sp. BvORR106]|uniref:hypothetical protein n=1 Tax=Verrucomicrobium sp. BvORR106 TaxID=1403819 RepID=UPI000A3EBE48|nr:hypothetical protein [Verrucomicrobium sp. BvORR106]